MTVIAKLIRWAGTKAWFAPMGRYLVTPLDKMLARRGVSATTWATGLPVGHLTSTGRISGEPRTAPLLYLVTESGSPAIVGTNFGGREHPQWAANLVANPKARWKVDAERAVHARRTTADEFATLWPLFINMWPGYADYVSRSQREPMMFVLEPSH